MMAIEIVILRGKMGVRRIGTEGMAVEDTTEDIQVEDGTFCVRIST